MKETHWAGCCPRCDCVIREISWLIIIFLARKLSGSVHSVDFVRSVVVLLKSIHIYCMCTCVFTAILTRRRNTITNLTTIK